MTKKVTVRVDRIQNRHKASQDLHLNRPQKDENLEVMDDEAPQDVEALQDVKEHHQGAKAQVVEGVPLAVEEVHHAVEEAHPDEKIDLGREVIVQKEIANALLLEGKSIEEIAHHKEGLASLLQEPEVAPIIQLEMLMIETVTWRATQEFF
jgi:hypothetical protein